MTIKLTWDDLLIQNITPEQFSLWLSEWGWLVSGRVAPVFMSKTGSWFLRRPDGTTEKLDVLSGQLSTIAHSDEEFANLVNSPAWQEEHLHSAFVYRMHELGKVPAEGQCYGLVPHPATGASANPETSMVLDIVVWQSICSQMLSQLKNNVA